MPEAPLEEAAQSEDGEVAAATPTEARNLFVGMIIDGVPESVAVGLSVHLGSVGVSLALVGSIFNGGKATCFAYAVAAA